MLSTVYSSCAATFSFSFPYSLCFMKATCHFESLDVDKDILTVNLLLVWVYYCEIGFISSSKTITNRGFSEEIFVYVLLCFILLAG